MFQTGTDNGAPVRLSPTVECSTGLEVPTVSCVETPREKVRICWSVERTEVVMVPYQDKKSPGPPKSVGGTYLLGVTYVIEELDFRGRLLPLRVERNDGDPPTLGSSKRSRDTTGDYCVALSKERHGLNRSDHRHGRVGQCGEEWRHDRSRADP